MSQPDAPTFYLDCERPVYSREGLRDDFPYPEGVCVKIQLERLFLPFPTREQIVAYLERTGWEISGKNDYHIFYKFHGSEVSVYKEEKFFGGLNMRSFLAYLEDIERTPANPDRTQEAILLDILKETP